MKPMSRPHALLLPYPAQGHVIPFLDLSYCLADGGFTVTFLNTHFNHHRVVAAMSNDRGGDTGQIRLVSIPDGLEPGEDRNDLGKLCNGLLKALPGCLEELIRESNKSGSGTMISCMIADQTLAWSLAVGKKMGLRTAAFSTTSAWSLASMMSIPKLIEEGVIYPDGAVKRGDMFQLSPEIHPMDPAHLMWNCMDTLETGRVLFNILLKNHRATEEMAELIVCNSFYEIEKPLFTYAPNFIPIGPLLTGHRFNKPVGHFWPEDSTCMAWLDEQPDNSVVYVAFGSLTVFNQRQFQELALGLELTGRSFLWVVRPNLTDRATDAYPVGFEERVAKRGKMVSWSPQQKVLSHPAIAFFVTHCGWNSTLEGVRNGVPFLCWSYFGDQLLNQSYICDVWRAGLKVVADETGIVSKEEIRSKVEMLFEDEGIQNKAKELMAIAGRSVSVGGSSFKNLDTFINAMK